MMRVKFVLYHWLPVHLVELVTFRCVVKCRKCQIARDKVFLRTTTWFYRFRNLSTETNHLLFSFTVGPFDILLLVISLRLAITITEILLVCTSFIKRMAIHWNQCAIVATTVKCWRMSYNGKIFIDVQVVQFIISTQLKSVYHTERNEIRWWTERHRPNATIVLAMVQDLIGSIVQYAESLRLTCIWIAL